MDYSCKWRITHNGYYDSYICMNESEYNHKIAEVALALVNHIISYAEWEQWMSLLIKNKENTEDDL